MEKTTKSGETKSNERERKREENRYGGTAAMTVLLNCNDGG